MARFANPAHSLKPLLSGVAIVSQRDSSWVTKIRDSTRVESLTRVKLSPEAAGVTFADSDSAPVTKVLNPGPAILQIWESNSCSDSGYDHRSNRNFPMFLPKKWPHRLLLLPKWKSDSGSGFSQIFDSGSGSQWKTQNPAGVDSGTPVRSHLWLSLG